jgi:hypothetical protein
MRYRRVTRRKLTAQEKRIRERADRAELRTDVLSHGIADQIRSLYNVADLKRILDLIATDLFPALKESEALRESLRARTRESRKNPPNAKKSAKNKKNV